MSLKTPLYNQHVEMGGRIVDFAGWQMPVQYSGIREEHNSVRTDCGMFDVSHMGEIRYKGPKALEALEWVTTNSVAKLENGQAHYSLIPNSEGGVVDDIIVYCIEKNSDYLVCVNASNRAKDFDHFIANNKGADITDESDKWAQIAIQGPKAEGHVKAVTGVWPDAAFRFLSFDFNGCHGWVARTGYTGEDGVECFIEAEQAENLWKAFAERGVAPCGLGARDTLRTEMKYPLYGNDIDDHANPYEAGLGWTVKAKAKEFIGREKMLSVKEAGLKKKLIGIKMIDKGVPRAGYLLKTFDNKEIGRVTSGTLSPSLNVGIGIAYLDLEHVEPGTEIAMDVRGRLAKVQVVKTPFVEQGEA